MTMSGPSVSSGSQSQRGGASGSMQSSPQSSSLGSPLMDNSHGTSASTGSGVQAGGQHTYNQEFRLLMMMRRSFILQWEKHAQGRGIPSGFRTP